VEDRKALVGGGAVPEGIAVKAKIFAVGLIDILIDLLLPTLVYLALTPTGRSIAVRLSVGGFCVAAKSVTGRVRAGGTDEATTGFGRRVVRALVVAVAASAVTLGLAFTDVGDTWAIVAGTLILGLAVVPILLQNSAIDGFALLVLGEVAISVVLVTISTDARFILVRPAFYTAIAGLYAIATCRTSQPFMMEVTRPIAAGGDPLRAEAFDRAWTNRPAFRRVELAMTLGLGVVLLGEAGLRVVAVYTQPADAVVHASLLSQLPAIVLFVGYLVLIRVFAVPIASREVDLEMLAAVPTPSPDPSTVDPSTVDPSTHDQNQAGH
jgi:hypothetical protein